MKKRGFRIEPCGTPEVISFSQSLRDDPILVFDFLGYLLSVLRQAKIIRKH